MRTSRQEESGQQHSDNPVRNWWKIFLLKLDARPSRTASFMAIILLVSAIWCSFVFFSRINKPKPEFETVPSLIKQIQEQYTDSLSITDKMLEFFMLLEIQREIQMMAGDTTKIDSARVEELFNMLNKR